jgi:sulfite reductase beta subunit-like hemoprotein
LRRQLPDLSESLRMLPQVIQQFVQQASEGRFRITVEQAGIEELRREIQAGARRRDATIVGSVTLLGGLVWLAIGPAWVPGVVLTAAGLLSIVLARR